LAELGKGGLQLASDVGGVILPQKFGGDPITDTQLMHHIVDPMQAEAAKARQGGPGSTGHAIASGIPVIGPYAAQLGEQAGSGDIGGALTKGVTQYLAPKAVAKAVPLAVKGVQRGVLLGKTPEAAYESALKPSTTLTEAERSSLVKTGLENEIPVSKAGIEKIGDLVDNLNQRIKGTIAQDPNRPISPQSVANRADAVRGKFANQVNPSADLAAIDASKQEFLDQYRSQPGAPGPTSPIGAADAQAMKQGTYRVLRGKYGEMGSASVEAQKALARGLKEEIASQFPELNNLNAAESKLLDLEPALERAVARTGNHQIIGIGTPAAAGAGTILTGSGKIGAAVGMMKAVLDNPMVKSKLAIAVSRASKVPISVANARVQSYVTSLGQFSAAQGSVSSGDNSSSQATQ
jgi:hypothetical protein